MVMQTRELKDLSDLVNAVSSLHEFLFSAPGSPLMPRNHIYYRGQEDAEWPLLPSLFRIKCATDTLQRLLEPSLFRDFIHQAQLRHPKCPDRDDYSGWLCLMQHYGLPTR